MRFLKVEIYTKRERNKAISQLVDAITEADGWVSGHQLFSNMAASISFEIPSVHISELLQTLEGCGFSPRVDNAFEARPGDVKGTISITFIHEEPDMKRDVPAFG